MVNEFETANANGMTRGHIPQATTELLRTVTGISDFWALKSFTSHREEIPPKATVEAPDLRDRGLELEKIEGVIAKSKGKGISKVIQEAAKGMRAMLNKRMEGIRVESVTTKKPCNPKEDRKEKEETTAEKPAKENEGRHEVIKP